MTIESTPVTATEIASALETAHANLARLAADPLEAIHEIANFHIQEIELKNKQLDEQLDQIANLRETNATLMHQNADLTKTYERRLADLATAHAERTELRIANQRQLADIAALHEECTALRQTMNKSTEAYREIAQHIMNHTPEFSRDCATVAESVQRLAQAHVALLAACREYFAEANIGPNGGPHIADFHRGVFCKRWTDFNQENPMGHVYLEDLPCTCHYAEIETIISPSIRSIRSIGSIPDQSTKSTTSTESTS